MENWNKLVPIIYSSFGLVFTPEDLVLLGRKKYGPSQGLMVFPGGKIKENETPAQCVVRETFEETGLRIYDPQLHNTIRFFDADLGVINLLHFYFVRLFLGNLQPSDELENFEWHPFVELPYDRMWPEFKVCQDIFQKTTHVEVARAGQKIKKISETSLK